MIDTKKIRKPVISDKPDSEFLDKTYKDFIYPDIFYLANNLDYVQYVKDRLNEELQDYGIKIEASYNYITISREDPSKRIPYRWKSKSYYA